MLNAGITRDGLAVRMSAEDWRAVIDTNLGGAFFVARPALRGMLRRRRRQHRGGVLRGRHHGNAGQANYAAAKAGLLGMVRSLAREAGSRGVRVNAVAPGYISDGLTDALTEEAARGGPRRHRRSGASASPRTWRGRGASCSRTRRPSSPARCWRSTAGWRCREEADDGA